MLWDTLYYVHPLFWDPELSRMHLHPQIQIPNAFPVALFRAYLDTIQMTLIKSLGADFLLDFWQGGKARQSILGRL